MIEGIDTAFTSLNMIMAPIGNYGPQRHHAFLSNHASYVNLISDEGVPCGYRIVCTEDGKRTMTEDDQPSSASFNMLIRLALSLETAHQT